MNGPRILCVWPDRDAATQAWVDHYRNKVRHSQVAYIGAVSPNPERPWAVVAPPADKAKRGP